MEIVKPGIEYRLHNFKSETEYQTVRFTEKTATGFNPGTTNEEVVSMLIDRLYALQNKNFSVENQCCIIWGSLGRGVKPKCDFCGLLGGGEEERKRERSSLDLHFRLVMLQ